MPFVLALLKMCSITSFLTSGMRKGTLFLVPQTAWIRTFTKGIFRRVRWAGLKPFVGYALVYPDLKVGVPLTQPFKLAQQKCIGFSPESASRFLIMPRIGKNLNTVLTHFVNQPVFIVNSS